MGSINNYYKIGNFIYEMRKRKGLSQNELGKILGVTNKAVSRWEMAGGYLILRYYYH